MTPVTFARWIPFDPLLTFRTDRYGEVEMLRQFVTVRPLVAPPFCGQPFHKPLQRLARGSGRKAKYLGSAK
jgi:hypothetical protein